LLIDAVLAGNAGALSAWGNGFSFPLPEKLVVQLSDSVNRKIKIGVRAHQILIKTQPDPGTIKMELQIIENLGKELLELFNNFSY
jgi:hypothetical protein